MPPCYARWGDASPYQSRDQDEPVFLACALAAAPRAFCQCYLVYRAGDNQAAPLRLGPYPAARMRNSVSIVIPTRNRSAILARCLAALPAGARGLAPPEVIVVDDCSNDGTCKVLDQFHSE